MPQLCATNTLRLRSAERLATLRTTTHSTRAPLLREAEPGHKRRIDRPIRASAPTAAVHAAHTRSQGTEGHSSSSSHLLHLHCRDTTNRLLLTSTALRSHAASLLLRSSSPSALALASRLATLSFLIRIAHFESLDASRIGPRNCLPSLALPSRSPPRTRRVDGRASTPVDDARSGGRRPRFFHTDANPCLTELISLAELAPVSARRHHGTIATRRCCSLRRPRRPAALLRRSTAAAPTPTHSSISVHLLD